MHQLCLISTVSHEPSIRSSMDDCLQCVCLFLSVCVASQEDTDVLDTCEDAAGE